MNMFVHESSMVLLDHEWMLPTGPEWASIPMLTGFADTPWEHRWRLVDGCDPVKLLVAYGTRFNRCMTPTKPAGTELRQGVAEAFAHFGVEPPTVP